MNKFKIIDLIRYTSLSTDFEFYKTLDNAKRNIILQDQQTRLADLLLHMKENNNFYKSLLNVFSANQIYTNPVMVLKTLPATNKKYLSYNYNNIFSKVKGRHPQLKHTGGSTGEPFHYHLDSKSISFGWSFVYQCWNKYAGYNLGDPYITIAGNSLHSSKRKIFERIYYLLQNNYVISGDIIKHNMRLNTRKLQSAKFIYGYPSSISVMIDLVPDFIRYLRSLKAVFTTSEVLLPQVRKKIENSLDIKVFDMYGANDGGIASCECQFHNGYHYNMLNTYIETIENEQGLKEMLVTSLNNYSFPLIRYKVGDLGEISTENCSCGSPYSKIINLKGRTRDLIYANNNIFHGSFFNSVFLHYPEIKLYKIIQQEDYSINLQLLVKPDEQFYTIAENLKRDLKKFFAGINISTTRMHKVDATNDKFKIIESHVI